MANQRLTTRPDKAVAEDTDVIYIVRPSDTSADPSGTGFKMQRSAFKTDLESLGIKHVQTIAEFNTLVSGATAGKWLISSDISLTASATIPADVTLCFNNSKIDLNGFTLTGVNTRIEAPLTQIFTTNGDLTGDWDVEGFYFEWFGAKGDGVKSDSIEIEKSLSYGGSLVKGVANKIYLLDAQITIPTAVDVEIDLQGATLKRKSTYTTAEPVLFAASALTKSITIHNGYIVDSSGVSSDSFLVINERLDIVIKNLHCTSEGSIFEIFNSNEIRVSDNTVVNLLAIPLNGSRLGGIQSCKTVIVKDNIMKNVYNAFSISSIFEGTTGDVKVLNNSVLGAYNTAIFCRLLGTSTGANSYKGCLIDGNYLENVGKAAIKFSSPSGNSGSMMKARIVNNHVRGFGFQVGSAGIAVFRADADTSLTIEDIVISNNHVDGFDTSGASSTITTGNQKGIRVSFVDGATINGNTIVNCLSDGVSIDNSTFINGQGNVVTNCCLNAIGTAGLYLRNVYNSVFDFVSRENQSTSSGVFLEQSQFIKISGVYSDNTNYGVEEDGGGTSSGTKCRQNTYSATAQNNTTGDFRYRGDVGLLSGREMHCVDTTGDRHTGTSARRDLISTNDFATNRNVGFVYWNQDNSDLEVRKSTSWKKFDGSAVTT